MICHAGITFLTDEAGTPVQVNIDLVRHGAELAAFLRAHGLVGGGSGTVCDELSGTVGGERLTCRYVPSADRRLIPVVYRSQVRPLLRAAVDKALLSLHGHKGTSAPAAEEYAATLLTAAERHLHGARLRHKPAPEGYERYGRDMFGLRFRLRCSSDTLWIICYTLHHGTVVVRYIGTEAKAEKK
ncbi:hypothetical protein [Alistipes onderdonkii]|uniref:hypothetical protein n=1 Tax=Alistipes onderdonkii TaxID=328813 RepID=UPI0032C05C24